MTRMDAPFYQCPGCGHAVSADPGKNLLQCPRCGEQFFVPASDSESSCEQTETDPSAPPTSTQTTDAELSELRIRQVSSLRRGAYRARSWCIIAAVVCAVAAIKLVQMLVVDWRSGMTLAPIGEALAAAAAVMICGHFARRVGQLTREIRNSRLADPLTPPDLSTLRDGTQRFAGLDELSDK